MNTDSAGSARSSILSEANGEEVRSLFHRDQCPDPGIDRMSVWDVEDLQVGRPYGCGGARVVRKKKRGGQVIPATLTQKETYNFIIFRRL